MKTTRKDGLNISMQFSGIPQYGQAQLTLRIVLTDLLIISSETFSVGY